MLESRFRPGRRTARRRRSRPEVNVLQRASLPRCWYLEHRDMCNDYIIIITIIIIIMVIISSSLFNRLID